MDLNFTFFAEVITFVILVAFTMKFIWPKLMKAIDERQAEISSGLAAAERGEKAFALAKKHIKKELQKSRDEAKGIIAKAHEASDLCLKEAKERAADLSRKSRLSLEKELKEKRDSWASEMQNYTSEIVLLASQKILAECLSNNSDLQKRIIQEIITDLDK